MKIVFYEKPGCLTNAKQISVLTQSGFEVERRNMLTQRWTKERLSMFFRGYLVSEWFNPAAPQIKQGTIKPDAISAEDAFQQMIQSPLLIKRPLIEIGNQAILGFRVIEIETASSRKLIGLEHAMEQCSKQ